MLKDNSIYIAHILERAEKILSYTQGMTETSFLKDDKTQSAVIRELEVIGEVTKKLSDDFKNQYPDIPWKIMAGMRDVLIHDYEGVNPFRVWDTIINNIPQLITDLKKLSK
ncbi:MAG: DUF86 domain-containing protein [Bacteroidetes bacterium]|nr:DUF86 domain-containing protein [Bacteroidota bacterium]